MFRHFLLLENYTSISRQKSGWIQKNQFYMRNGFFKKQIPYVIPKNTYTQNAFRYFSWHVHDWKFAKAERQSSMVGQLHAWSKYSRKPQLHSSKFKTWSVDGSRSFPEKVEKLKQLEGKKQQSPHTSEDSRLIDSSVGWLIDWFIKSQFRH